MATENPKVVGYVQPTNYQKLEAFQKNRGLRSLSQALDVILTEFLGAADSKGNESLESRLTALEEEMGKYAACFSPQRLIGL